MYLKHITKIIFLNHKKELLNKYKYNNILYLFVSLVNYKYINDILFKYFITKFTIKDEILKEWFYENKKYTRIRNTNK